jgi:hypothetical protein
MTTARAKSKLAWALEHAALGIPVLPLAVLTKNGTCLCRRRAACKSPGKHPLVGRGFYVATTDREQIRRWWKEWPKANIGGRTGGEWLVVDVDPRNGGDESLAAFEAEHGELPRSAVVKTGLYDGGRHFWYRIDGQQIGSGKPLRGIEIKAEGGYVVLPGSTHATGVDYEWQEKPAFEPAPTQLAALTPTQTDVHELGTREITGLPLSRRTRRAVREGLPEPDGVTQREVAVGFARNIHEAGAPPAIGLELFKAILRHRDSSLDPADPWTDDDAEGIYSSVVRVAAPDREGKRPERARGAKQVLHEARVDLIQLLHDGIPPMEFVPGNDLWLIRGKRYLFPAPAGTGKSLVGLIVAVAAVRAGGSVAILDVENGEIEYARRLGALLAGEASASLTEACAERLRYYAWPRLSMRWPAEEWAEAVGEVDLVIFDSSRMILSAGGLDEDSNNDYAAFAHALLFPLSQQNVTTIVLDNTGHLHRRRARGASAKIDLNEIVYSIEVGTAFDIDTTGELLMRCQRERPGVPQALTVPIGGGVYGPIVLAQDDRVQVSTTRDEEARHAVMMTVKRTPGINKRSLRQAVRGYGAETVDAAVEALASRRWLKIEVRGSARLHYAVPSADRESLS